ncbi:hypothetical protein SN15_03940 [Stenotrophomonas maltophilia]|nr:hypothetical protein SN15_03940 [Stenotrophomonas maltophilia]
MPLDFQSRLGAAYDAASGITIPEPRTLPMTMPDGGPGTEYQYAFYQNGRRIGGLGLWGQNRTEEIAGSMVSVFFLEIVHSQSIISMLKLRQSVPEPEGHFKFLFGVARGLVMAHAFQTSNRRDLRYVAVTSVDALIQAGFDVPNPKLMSQRGPVILAESTVPSNAGKGGAHG